jgi:hypothetical protein
MHAIKVNSIALTRKKKFFLRSKVEIQIQLLPSPIRPDEFSARRANCFYCGIHAWPIIKRVENMMHFGVTLMVDFRMRALDESLLFIYWN